MHLFLLRRESCGLDEVREFVVRAETPAKARQFASKQPGDEGAKTWLRSSDSTCECLTPIGLAGLCAEAGVVVRAFVPG
jgi:hypothetical protein